MEKIELNPTERKINFYQNKMESASKKLHNVRFIVGIVFMVYWYGSMPIYAFINSTKATLDIVSKYAMLTALVAIILLSTLKYLIIQFYESRIASLDKRISNYSANISTK